MKKIRENNGAITIIVLVSVLFIVSFLIITYVIVENKVQTQKEVIAETKRIYESNTIMEEIYNSFFAQDEIIPIYTNEQLSNIGSNSYIYIGQKRKYYNFTNDATYILMNDLNYSEDVISKTFEGLFDGNGHTITITNELEEQCIGNTENNFHGLLLNVPTDFEEDIDKISNIIDGVIIPTGFKYIRGTKNTGIIITDSYSGTEEDNGNEFVWIPVDNINSFTRTSFRNGDRLSDSKAFNTYWMDETTEEYINLRLSVQKYKGFYFGRYEASKVPDNEANIAQVKRNYTPWVNTNGESVIDIASTKSSSMYNNIGNYYDNISTHLVYPQEWDTTMNWLIQTGAKTQEEISTNSSSWGNYKVLKNLTNISTLKVTGYSEDWVANNIYDLAGNVTEVTQELNGLLSSSSIRGGGYKEYGSDNPAGSRDDYLGLANKDDVGFRICMMINI